MSTTWRIGAGLWTGGYLFLNLSTDL
jgi:hypothetical protein